MSLMRRGNRLARPASGLVSLAIGVCVVVRWRVWLGLGEGGFGGERTLARASLG